MARIRSVHPGLFTDEAFMELTVDCLAAIPLLLGLWCEADDGGAFEWKPIVLKARYLPAAAENAAALLERLAALNFIRRFEVEGRAIGVVRNFSKYQRPKSPQFKLPTTAPMRVFAGSEIEAAEVLSFPPKAEIDPQRKEEGEGGESPSSAGASARSPEIDLASARPMATSRRLEAECRIVMDGVPVVIDMDFSPISALLDEPGVTEADVIAGLTEAASAPGFRPVSWRQCAGWVRKAAKNRLAARLATSRGRSRAPPGGGAMRKPSDLEACLELMHGDERSNVELGSASVGPAGPLPVIEGHAVAL